MLNLFQHLIKIIKNEIPCQARNDKSNENLQRFLSKNSFQIFIFKLHR